MNPAVLTILEQALERMKADWCIHATIGLIDHDLYDRRFTVYGDVVHLGNHQYLIRIRAGAGIVEGLTSLAHEMRHIMDWESGIWIGWTWDGRDYSHLKSEAFYRQRPWEIAAWQWQQKGIGYL